MMRWITICLALLLFACADKPTETPQVADDGNRPLRLLAVLMGLLALLLGAFTRWYWKATTPPARRGYLPDQQSSPLP